MRGRFEQQLALNGALQEQLTAMANEVVGLQDLVRNPQQNPSAAIPQPAQRVLTDEERSTYGDELINTMKRAAQEAVQPELTRLQAENDRLARQATQQAKQRMYVDLSNAVPEWRTVNKDPRFLAWLALPDVYANQVRKSLLNAALQAADANRVVAFFKGFLAEEQATGHVPVPQPTAADPSAPTRIAAVSLATLSAPGVAVPASGGTQVPDAKPVYTHKQISQFYRDKTTGRWAGREAEAAAIELDIIAAGREGRVR